jgi:DNA-binding SARP family transcriptional activator/tetratricopeptide (TPR) repeat protein
VEFRVLGPVEADVDGRMVDLGRPQQRLVLAVLLVDAGRPVSTEALIDRVWDIAPDGARRTLQVHITRLRRVLDGCSVELIRRSGGYVLDADPDRVDWHRFRRLVDQARRPECPGPAQATLLGQALELWSGPPLAGLPGRWAARVRQGWQQQYVEAVVAWAQASLGLGDPGVVLPRLGELVGEHPLAESVAAAYMRALYAAGRPADALEHYTAIRCRLAEELGTDPSPELRRLHRQILSADPALAVPAPAVRESIPVPRQLPAPPQSFTGRAAELADIDRMPDRSTVVITAIDGMAGIGKTALAVHAAHRVADRYPDGQLFVDLHGYTRDLKPTEPGDAFEQILRALGVSGGQIPAGIEQRAALYRTRLAGRRMLILLDNAADEAQVTPLLPGAPGCLVLVTSRRRLTGLDHTHTLSLDILPTQDAVTLFRQVLGDDRLVGQPPELLAELVALCGRLPLAIRIAAARLRSHPAWSVTHLVERLRDQRHRLAELEAGRRSVTAALDLSYQDLDAEHQRAYRLLGLDPGPDFDAYTTAALLDTTLRRAGRMLDQLLGAHLLLEPVAGRYRFHDLVRVHAAGIAARDQAQPAAPTALHRLLDYYRHTASVAMDVAYPYERERRPRVPPARTPTPDLSGPAAALTWLDTELPNLLALAGYAAEHNMPAPLPDLSTTLHRHLRTRGRYQDAETLHHHALAAARATDHLAGELNALLGLGWVQQLQGRHTQASDHYRTALRIARTIDHRHGELDALTGLGDIHWVQGRHQPATDHLGQALRIARTVGYRHGELAALLGLGHVHRLRGRHQLAASYLGQALRVAGSIDHRPGELAALTGLGRVHLRTGSYALAASHYRPALQLARATGHRNGELAALTGLGDIDRRQGRYEQAADHYRHLLELAQESGERNFEFEARQGLGRVLSTMGDPDAAIAHHERALGLAEGLGQPVDQARAHDGLAHAYRALHHDAQACRHWRQALTILTGLDVDHTDEEETTVAAIRANLSDLEGHTL